MTVNFFKFVSTLKKYKNTKPSFFINISSYLPWTTHLYKSSTNLGLTTYIFPDDGVYQIVVWTEDNVRLLHNVPRHEVRARLEMRKHEILQKLSTGHT